MSDYSFQIPVADLREGGNTRHGINSIKDELSYLRREFRVNAHANRFGDHYTVTVSGVHERVRKVYQLMH